MFFKETDFKETSVGKTPKEWEVVTLGDVCDQRNEMFQPTGNNTNRFVGLEHISSGETRVHTYAQEVALKSSKFRFYEEDILYGKLRPYLDKAALVDFDGICSTDLLVLKPRRDIAKEFIVYVLHSEEFLKHAISTTSGTNHPRTSWKAISRFKFGLPKTPERQMITNVLGVVDLAVARTGEVIAKTERLKKGLMQALLTRGIGHKEHKQTPIGKIPKEWEVRNIKEVAEVVNGHVFPPKYQGRQGLKYLYAKVNDFNLPSNKKYIRTTENTIDDEDIHQLKIRIYPPGSIIFPERGAAIYLNRKRILASHGTFDNNLMGIVPKGELAHDEFLYYYFVARVGLTQMSSATTTPLITKGTMERIEVPIPQLPERQKIAKTLSAIDEKLELERREKARLQKIKTGLMDLLLTGKVRVKVD